MEDLLTSRDSERCAGDNRNLVVEAVRLHDAGRLDSVLEMVNLVRWECGDTYQTERIRMILALDGGWFADSLYDAGVIARMPNSHYGRLGYTDCIEALKGYFGPQDAEISCRFNQIMDSIAHHALASLQPSSEAAVFALVYSGQSDSGYALLQSRALVQSPLRTHYDDHIDRLMRRLSVPWHYALGLGTWFPQGSNRILGRHPAVDLSLGIEDLEDRWRADLIIATRFGRAKNAYLVKGKGNVLETTRDYSGWFFGSEAGYLLPDLWLTRTDVFGGLGLDALPGVASGEDDVDRKGHGCVALSVGVRTRVFLDRWHGWYVGACYRYTVGGHRNAGGNRPQWRLSPTVSRVWEINQRQIE